MIYRFSIFAQVFLCFSGLNSFKFRLFLLITYFNNMAGRHFENFDFVISPVGEYNRLVRQI